MTYSPGLAQRTEFRGGTRLLRTDLARADSRERAVIGRHIVHGHGTWGVALGLRMLLSDDRSAVLVTPGLAFSCDGTALVEPVTRVLQLPATPGRFFLQIGVGRRVAPIACPPAASPDSAPPAVSYCWVELQRVSVRPRQVVLGAARVTNGLGTLEPGLRDHTRRLEPPRLATAEESVGWSLSGSAYLATVDLSNHRFGAAPLCFAQLGADAALPGDLVGPFLSIGDRSATEFDVEARFASPTDAFAPFSGDVEEWLASATLHWTAVEVTAGDLEPPIDRDRIYALSGARVTDLQRWTKALRAMEP